MRGVLWKYQTHEHGDMQLVERWTRDADTGAPIDWRLSLERRTWADALCAGMWDAGIGRTEGWADA